MLLFLIFALVLVSSIVRLITIPFRYRRRSNRYGHAYNPYRLGCRRHHRVLGRVLPILALVALDRVFRRY